MQPPPTPTPTPTPTLTLPQIQFLNNFLYGKPPSFRNPNTLFKALHKLPHIHTYNKLHLSLTLLKLYTHLLFKQQLYIYTNTLHNTLHNTLTHAAANPPPAIVAPPPQQPPPQAPPQAPYKPRRFKKFTNFLKKTFKKKSVAPVAAIAPPVPNVPTLSVPLPTPNPMTHVILPHHGVRAPRVSSKSSTSVSYLKGKKYHKKFTRRRGRVSSPHSSDSEASRRGLLVSSSDESASIIPGRRTLRAISKIPSSEPISLPISESDLAKRLVSKGALPLSKSEQAAKDSADLKRAIPVYYGLRKGIYGLRKGIKNIKTKTRKKIDAWKLKRASAKGIPLASKSASLSKASASSSASASPVILRRSAAPRSKMVPMVLPIRIRARGIAAPRRSSSSASSAPSVRGRALAPAPRGSSQKGIVGWFKKTFSRNKTQRLPVGKVVGERLLESPSRSSSPVASRPASPASSRKSSASSRKSSSSAAPSLSGIVVPAPIGSPKKGIVGWFKKTFSRKKTQRLPVGKVVGERLLESPSRSSSPVASRPASPASSRKSSASSRKSSSSAAPSLSGIVVPAPIGSPKKGLLARASAYISRKTRRRPVARPVGEGLLESPSRSPSPAPRAAIARMDVPVRIGAPRKSSSSSASSAPSVSGRAVAPAPSGSPKKGIFARAIAYISKKTQRRPVGKVAGDRLLESPSKSASPASSRKSSSSAASSRKSSSSAASSRKSSSSAASSRKSSSSAASSRKSSSPAASSRSSWSSHDSLKPAPKISFKINPLPGPKGAIAMGGPKSPKPIKTLRPVVTPPASPKGKGWDAHLPAWLGHVTPPPVVKKGIRGTPFPASPIEATEDWKPSSFFDSVKGTPVMVSDLGWELSPAKKLSASKSMKAKGALSTGKAISGLLDLTAIGTEEEKVARKKADKLKKHQMLIHQGKIKEANAYLEKHKLKPSMDAIDDIIGHVSVVMDKSGTPHLVSPKTKSSMDYLKSPKTKNSVDYLESPLEVVELTPSSSEGSSNGRKNPLSFGQKVKILEDQAWELRYDKKSGRTYYYNTMTKQIEPDIPGNSHLLNLATSASRVSAKPFVLAKGTPIKGANIRALSDKPRSSIKKVSEEDAISKLHKSLVNPGVSPTFAKHDSKKGDWV